jgi:hypothetical protein
MNELFRQVFAFGPIYGGWTWGSVFVISISLGLMILVLYVGGFFRMNPAINDQTSGEWHKWRGKGIGSSDAPIIMGEEQYLTKHQLCLEKLGVWKRPEAGFAAQFGTAFEPLARARFNLIHDMDMKPECAEHAEFPYLRASLDGADLTKTGVH